MNRGVPPTPKPQWLRRNAGNNYQWGFCFSVMINVIVILCSGFFTFCRQWHKSDFQYTDTNFVLLDMQYWIEGGVCGFVLGVMSGGAG